jgi:hypothetical protein
MDEAGLLLKALPTLLETSDNILRDWAPKEFTYENAEEDLSDDSTRDALDSQRSSLQAQMEPFGANPFISASKVLETLPFPADAEREPAPMLQKPNLARLVLDVLSNDRPLKQQFEPLDKCFPYWFIGSFMYPDGSENTSLLDETYSLALEVRTQYCLASLRQGLERGDRPARTVRNVFYVPGIARHLRGWLVQRLDDESRVIPPQFADQVSTQVKSILQAISDGDPNMDDLEAMFPWSEFVEKLIGWVVQAAAHIDTQAPRESLDGWLATFKNRRDGPSSYEQAVESRPEKPVEEPAPTPHDGSFRNMEREKQDRAQEPVEPAPAPKRYPRSPLTSFTSPTPLAHTFFLANPSAPKR